MTVIHLRRHQVSPILRIRSQMLRLQSEILLFHGTSASRFPSWHLVPTERKLQPSTGFRPAISLSLSYDTARYWALQAAYADATADPAHAATVPTPRPWVLGLRVRDLFERGVFLSYVNDRLNTVGDSNIAYDVAAWTPIDLTQIPYVHVQYPPEQNPIRPAPLHTMQHPDWQLLTVYDLYHSLSARANISICTPGPKVPALKRA